MKVGYRILNIGYRKAGKVRRLATTYILYSVFHILTAPAVAAPFASWIDVKAECGASFSLS